MEHRITSPADPKLTDLMQRLRDGVLLPDDERSRMLRAMIDLYQPDPWAEPALKVARQQLSAMQEQDRPDDGKQDESIRPEADENGDDE